MRDQAARSGGEAEENRLIQSLGRERANVSFSTRRRCRPVAGAAWRAHTAPVEEKQEHRGSIEFQRLFASHVHHAVRTRRGEAARPRLIFEAFLSPPAPTD